MMELCRGVTCISVGLLLGCCLLPVYGQTNWTNCVPDEFSDPIFVHSIIIEPLKIVFPGTVNVSFDAVIDSDVDELVIDVEVGLQNETTGVITKVYPLDKDYWRVFTACLMIDKTLFRNVSDVEFDLDIQINKVMMGALKYLPGCPLLQGRIQFHQQPLMLRYNAIELNALRLGRYVLKVTYKSSHDKYLGCLQTHVEYGGQIMN